MTTHQHLKLLETYRKFSLHYLTGHNLEWYFRVISRPVLYLASLNVVFLLVSNLPNLGMTFNVVFISIIFLVELITYGWIGYLVAYKASWKTLPTSMKIGSSAVSGALTGFLLGLFMALWRVFWFRATWTFFNIITEPTIRLLEGLIVAGLVGLLTLTILKIRNREN